MAKKNVHTEKSASMLRRFFSALGPGLVTGAADDDPSGIVTYSIAGAGSGMSFLWLAWITWPLMAAVQMMCARVGMTTGQGLIGALKQKVPSKLLALICISLLAANTINIAADLSGMADACEMMSGVPAVYFIIFFGILICYSIIKFHYARIANILKWLALSLLAYVVTAFILNPNWPEVANKTFTLSMPKGKNAWQTVVAILGTTISPYLFVWQAAQEIEEEKAKGHKTLQQRKGTNQTALTDRMMDVGIGTLLSNIVMFFIILTTALTLHTHGITHISSSKEAAEALKPLAGDLATALYTIGIVTGGILAIPTLAGASAYAFAEAYDWSQGLDKKLKQARAFYGVIIFSVICGVVMDFFHINPMQLLFWSAIINGILAPFLLCGLWVVARDKKLMVGQPSSKFNQVMVAITALTMFLAAITMFV